jgi:ATP-dependent Lon protease
MEFPSEMPVMILDHATLFPQAFLPLRIFEPRYRRMLDDSLHSHRMVAVAMQKPGRHCETPCSVAGLGLVRASVMAGDGTSNLILQGLTRVEVEGAVRYRPYRVHRIRPLASTAGNGVAADALTARVLELVAERLQQAAAPGATTSEPGSGDPETATPRSLPDPKTASILTSLDNPDQVADLISWTLLSDPVQRQELLETLDVELRLRRLIRFLLTGTQGPKSN